MGKALKRRTRTFCLKRRKKGGNPEKGGKRRNLTPCISETLDGETIGSQRARKEDENAYPEPGKGLFILGELGGV